jgi:transmembrane sensor
MSPGALDVDAATLARYLSGECGPADTRTIERWIDADPARRARVDALRKAWTGELGASASPTPWRVGEMRAAVQRFVAASAVTTTPRRDTAQVPTRRARRGRMVVVAALSAVASVATMVFVHTGRPSGGGQPATRDVTTARGQRASVHLSDGTLVVLGVDSKLTLPTMFASDRRDVTLRGAAYFEVVHDPTRPFRVHTEHAITRVLGTTFGVWAYPGGEPVRVAVASGRVEVTPRVPSTEADRSGPPPTALTAGMSAAIASDGQVRIMPNADVAAALAWTAGRLTFTHVPLRDALPQLERWYDITIRVPDAARSTYELSATFGAEFVTNALDVLSAALALPYVYDPRTRTAVFMPAAS